MTIPATCSSCSSSGRPRQPTSRALRAAIVGREAIEAVGAHAYLVYPDGIGRSRLTTALIERTLGTRGTGRNWNTVVEAGRAGGAPEPWRWR